MDLCRGSVVVDAKSLLGIMNLGFNQTVNLKSTATTANELFQNIREVQSSITQKTFNLFVPHTRQSSLGYSVFYFRKIVVESI